MALVNLGGGEIILILVLILILAVIVTGFAAVVYLIVRAIVNRSSSARPALPPAGNVRDQQERDRDQLKLLAIFHFVFAGLGFLGMGFLCLHYLIMHTVFSNPEMWKQQQHPPFSPQEFMSVFVWFYLFMGVFLVTGIVLNALSGFFLLHKKNRTFSLIVAGLDCLQIPFGTALGVFTIVVLSRPTVSLLYNRQTGPVDREA